ncbi:putative uncharacterized protein YGR160W [Macadamia integrifolia]|uniref:putative uncharacterized protein YGR160W n=1 Tax=Macadamia integrifolia TaxID=60698 RepID=UPI001C4FC65F|nr:putative uncharacterized protein YGR160W [Macadamia integrifolia]
MYNEKGTSREKNKTRDEVEELLLAAEDDLLLNLNLNSHLSHSSSSSSPLDHDLSRRFEALKSSKSARVPPSQTQQQEKTSAAPKLTSDSTIITKMPLPETQQKEKSKEEEELERVIGADLSARFAALRGDSSSKTSTESQLRSKSGDTDDDDVEKVIQWANDAARLDPSSPTDEDEDEDEDEEEEEDEDDDYDGESGEDDDDDVEHGKREQTRKRRHK